MKRDKDVLGWQFGLLTVVAYAGIKNKYFPTWACRCRCWNTARVTIYHLLSEHTKSCGCSMAQHGEARDNKWSVEYNVWHHIKDRCFNPNDKKYPQYGGRGITMLAAWKDSYEVFRDYLLSTIGRRPGKGYSIDRINNNGNYEPGNVRWATIVEQNNNLRRNTARLPHS